MDSIALNEHVALRIGLAAKALKGVEVKSLLALLTTNLGTHLSEEKLTSLSPKKWRSMAAKLSHDFSRYDLDSAYAVLSSLTIGETDEPTISDEQPLSEPSLTVAITSNREQQLDGHFGSCLRILVYQVSQNTHQLVDIRSVNTQLKGEERSVYLVSLLEGCDLLFTLSIGGPAAAKVTRAGVHPVKVKAPCASQIQLDELSAVLANNPPKWLANKLAPAIPA